MSRRRCFLTGLGIGLVLCPFVFHMALWADEFLMNWTERDG